MNRQPVQLPPLFTVTDETAIAGQRTVKRMVAAELLLLVAAATAGAIPLRLGGSISPGALAAGVAFAGALVVGAFFARGRAHQRWYDSRAAAESVKTVAWRFAVGGTPFPKAMGEQRAGGLLLERLAELVDQLDGIKVPTPLDDDGQITEWMLRTRRGDLDTRKSVYQDLRLEDQLTWYASRARTHSRTATRWAALAAGANAAGIAGAVVQGFGILDIDVLGIAATVGASGAAWLQFRQHRVLRVSYAATEHELTLASARVDAATSDGEWAEFVGEVENAMSTEHSRWLASRRAITELR